MTVVFKLGGSLLKLPGLAEKLQAVLEQRADEQCLIVTGGGTAADIVREWSQVHTLTDESAHWLAIDSLTLNRRLLETLVGWKPVQTRDQAHRMRGESLTPLLLDLATFARTESSVDSDPIPHNWEVTSDSLAAWVTLRWPANELVLLKSIPIPAGINVWQASQAGLVDSYFPQLAGRIPRIGWCDLRSPHQDIEPWLKQTDSAPGPH